MTNYRSCPIRLVERCIRALTRALIALLLIFSPAVGAAAPVPSNAAEPTTDRDAWTVAKHMGVGINIGNTLDNTSSWETGWGNPPITKEHIQTLAALGFKTVRVPVAWDTYAHDGRIDRKKLERVGQVVDWILSEGMFCVVNIHWDGGWIDSDDKNRFGKTFATFTPEAELKFQSYWGQIATYFADRDQRLIFEGLNEETNFSGMGSEKKAYQTLTHVNQLFTDTVRSTGGNNARRPLIVTGYATDITKTTSGNYTLPKDSVPHKLLLSVHYYTPWPFVGMTEDASWGKMRRTWGTSSDIAELNGLLDRMQLFATKNDIPVFIGEFGVDVSKDPDSRLRWMKAVAEGALARKMVPVLWEIGQEISRKPPIAISPEMGAFLVDMGLVKDPDEEKAAPAK
jgi:endoglucanase